DDNKCRRASFIALSDIDAAGFFFSSRRRHTRWPRDWSSDVCSSDLVDEISNHLRFKISSTANSQSQPAGSTSTISSRRPENHIRSEERRVGKECRTGWLADH